MCLFPKLVLLKRQQKRHQSTINTRAITVKDYVLELLDDLEEKRIIDGEDVKYKMKKDVVKRKQEGLAR